MAKNKHFLYSDLLVWSPLLLLNLLDDINKDMNLFQIIAGNVWHD